MTLHSVCGQLGIHGKSQHESIGNRDVTSAHALNCRLRMLCAFCRRMWHGCVMNILYKLLENRKS